MECFLDSGYMDAFRQINDDKKGFAWKKLNPDKKHKKNRRPMVM